MFVHYFTHVPLNVSDVETRLDSLRNNLTDMADVAYREGEELRSKVSPWVDGYAKEVELRIGTAELHRTGIAYPITWTATGAQVLFPKLEAELLLAHVGKNSTRIAIEGTYEPPLGFVGKVADRAVLGRYADAAVRNWLDGLAAALVENSTSTESEAG
ncbi:MAG: hypothetical protein U9N56_02835 [Actinomycetota bacterium]|nr:hypothetical protein [Actinomycetota bacterium]